MRIMPVSQPCFKGLWEVKDKDYNYSGVTNAWDISYIYHPFKDEFVSTTKPLEEQVPEPHDKVDTEAFSRHYYFTNFKLGDKLDVTENEFNSDKKSTLDSLGNHYAETTEELPAERFYNSESLKSFYDEEMAKQLQFEKEHPEEAKIIREKAKKFLEDM